MTTDEVGQKGREYAPGIVGKGQFRIRERCVADRICPLISGSQSGAAKLYIALRGIALLPEHAGGREVGLVLPHIRFEELHDLIHPRAAYDDAAQHAEDPLAAERKAKRQRIARHLEALEALRLLKVEEQPGRRPKVVLLKDDGSKEPLDDPEGGGEDDYVSILGSLIGTDEFRGWSGRATIAYICAMQAARRALNRADAPKSMQLGDAEWVQTAAWFTTEERRRPAGHVLYPVSPQTVRRGLRELEDQKLLDSEVTSDRPRWWRGGAKRFQFPRKVYTNAFDKYESTAELVDLADERERRAG